MHKKSLFLAVLLGVWLFGWKVAQASVTCEIVPNYIPIHFLYHGEHVKIFGRSDHQADYVVVIRDQDRKEVLRRKGKVKGLFWMNVGEISFEPVPGVFMVFASKPLDQILDTTQQAHYGIGYNALFHKVKVEGVPEKEDAQWIKEFIKFKEHLHLYREKYGAIRVKTQGSGSAYEVELDWPFQAPPGVYTVTIYVIKNGQVVDKCQDTIEVEKTGILKTVSDLAFQRPALYGIIAIVIAVVAGVGVGLVFGGRGGH